MEPSKNLRRIKPENAKPYPLLDNGEDLYTFISDHDICYGLQFKGGPLPVLLAEYPFEIREFEFLVAGGKKPVQDERIAATIVCTLRNYFNSALKVIVYICDEEGNKKRGAFRQRLFIEWHKQMGDGFRIYQFTPELNTNRGSYELYAGIIYRADCPHSQTLIQEIETAAPDVIRAKYFEEDTSE